MEQPEVACPAVTKLHCQAIGHLNFGTKEVLKCILKNLAFDPYGEKGSTLPSLRLSARVNIKPRETLIFISEMERKKASV